MPKIYITSEQFGSAFYLDGNDLCQVPLSASTGEPVWDDYGIIYLWLIEDENVPAMKAIRKSLALLNAELEVA